MAGYGDSPGLGYRAALSGGGAVDKDVIGAWDMENKYMTLTTVRVSGVGKSSSVFIWQSCIKS